MSEELALSVGVILPAAGSGERLGIPKQYFEIKGKPLFLYSVEVFEEISWITSIILVADDVNKMNNLIEKRENNSSKIIVVQGGNTRHKSIKAGLDHLIENTGNKCEIVIIHDAVRPLISNDLIKKLVENANLYGASGPTRPLISTVISSNNDNFLESTLDRNKFLNSETPQAFKLNHLLTAYKNITVEELENGTECLQLVLKYCKIKAKLIKGDENLWKVTLRKDLHSAIGCINAEETNVCIYAPNVNDKIIGEIIKELSWKVHKIHHIKNTHMNGHSSEIIFNKLIIFKEGLDNNENQLNYPSINLMNQVHIIMNLKESKDILYKLGTSYIQNYQHIALIFVTDDVMHLIPILSNIIINDNLFNQQIFIL